MTSMPRVLGMVAAFACFGRGAPCETTKPPVAPVHAVQDIHHGTTVSDPYRYMETFDHPEVQAWVRSQADYTNALLGKVPGRDALLARIEELDAGAPYTMSSFRRMPDGTLYYLKRMTGERLAKVYVREASGKERLLVDPDAYAPKDGGHAALEFFRVSPDGRLLLFGIAPSGSEETTLHALEVESGRLLPDTIDRMEAVYTPPMWLPNSSGFVYSRRPVQPPGAPPTEGYKRTYALFHRLGTDPERDPVVFSQTATPDVPMTEVDFPSLVVSEASKHVIGKIKHGDSNELTLWTAPLDALTAAKVPWKAVCAVSDSVVDFAVRGDDVYLVTARGAPRYKVVRTSLAAPDFARAAVVVPPGETVVDGLAVARDALYVAILDGGVNGILRVGYAGGTPERLEMPADEPSGFIQAASARLDGVFVGTSSWTKEGPLYVYDPVAKTLADTGLEPRGKFDDLGAFTSTEVKVKSHDGVLVPLSIVHRKDLKLDGTNPTLLNGYGAYGISMSVSYSATRVAWLERGGVWAVAHVRGGGEYGSAWHLAGKGPTKPNTWKDFNACAEWLVANKYTSPEHLAGKGTSAGGILIGRAITERPDLYGAAIVNVGCTDMVRMETTTNGVPNIPEFGTVQTEAGFRGLYEMSAYHHVQDGVSYPAVLVIHGINDPRVEPWMSAKVTARLQAATASGKPVLFRVDYDAGHGIGSTRVQQQKQMADEWAFLLWQLGAPLRAPGAEETPSPAAGSTGGRAPRER